MERDYDRIITDAAERVFKIMSRRVMPEDMARLRKAFDFAKEAHKEQRRKSGEPYIVHPIAVATIAAEEMKLDANSVMAAFLHDVVEDTPTTVDDIKDMFGEDVAHLVDVVTKKKKKEYRTSKQVDNYEQLLDSVHWDIRALLVKIADRLHNMRTLSSMRPAKQMKIAGETDYFYAPLANRLGLFDVKTDLENLAFKFRCFNEYTSLAESLEQDKRANRVRLDKFTREVNELLSENGVDAETEVYYRAPYSIWRKMKAHHVDFKHVPNRYYIRVTFSRCSDTRLSEKEVCLKIYSILTNRYREKSQSFVNQIDQAKENSYQSINVMLLSDSGIWEDVQICSHRMVEVSKLGCVAERDESNVQGWIDKFRDVLKDIAAQEHKGNFLEQVATTLYYDDVMVFTPQGRPVVLPKGATAIDFAFEIHTDVGLHAKYARINGNLCSVKTVLKKGDCVEIGTEPNMHPKEDWIEHCKSYKATRALRAIISQQQAGEMLRCPHCKPLPGGETIGYKLHDGKIMVHRRNCSEVIRMASKHGDSIVDIDYTANETDVFPVGIAIKAIDRYHLLIDLIDNITNKLGLSIDSLTTVTKDEIVECQITFFVHSVQELNEALDEIYTIQGVDEVRHVHRAGVA